MGKIIDFWQARQKLELNGLASALKWERDRDKPPEPEKPYAGPTKKPRIISALPGEMIPPRIPGLPPLPPKGRAYSPRLVQVGQCPFVFPG